ncbi:serine hydrolase domain-containing protein [Nonomuraea monospora]|uniref:Serine hydrolase domain-containing protein n=1 Tax=Nonomuraea monospora TaxID=568818 RepID=A0ABN3CU40_9ACTN
MALVAAGQPAAQAVADPSPADWRAFHEYLEELAEAGKFSGTVLVAKNGREVLNKGYGMADAAKKKANTPQTRFSIGSMGKMLTGVAIAQLVQQGKVSFQDTIGKYVDGLPSEIAGKVTVHHLLTHTSGLGEIPAHDGKGDLDLDAQLKAIAQQKLQFEPGTRFGYSNAGFAVLGAIVESVSKQRYDAYVSKHILKPAGMHDTSFGSRTGTYTPSKVARMAHPYGLFDASGKWVGGQAAPDGSLPDGELRDVGDQATGAGPAGGAISTAGDMLKFTQALRKHKLLNAKLTETVLEGKVETGPQNKYAYGFMDWTRNGVRAVGHSGATMGYEAMLDVFVTKGYTVVFLVNQDGVMTPPLKKARALITD